MHHSAHPQQANEFSGQRHWVPSCVFIGTYGTSSDRTVPDEGDMSGIFDIQCGLSETLSAILSHCLAFTFSHLRHAYPHTPPCIVSLIIFELVYSCFNINVSDS